MSAPTSCGHTAALTFAALCRYCCKSLFAQATKNSPGCRRDFRVKMWGTSSPDEKLTSDLRNAIEGTQIGGRRSGRLAAGKLSPGNFGLLQQYLPRADLMHCSKSILTRVARRALTLHHLLNPTVSRRHPMAAWRARQEIAVANFSHRPRFSPRARAHP